MQRYILLFLLLFPIGSLSGQQTTSTELAMECQGLVDVQDVVPDVFVSLMYARPDNFVGKTLYRDLRKAYLLPEAAQALKKAQQALKRAHPQYSLIIFDATRPMSVQQTMWNAVAGTSKSIYVSNPKNGGGLHNYGLAVDVALCWARDVFDRKGRKIHAAGDTAGIAMGTPVDHLGRLAHVKDETRLYRKKLLTDRHIRNRHILREAMKSGGFKVLPTEWWHFNFKTRAEAKARYRPIR